MTDLLDYVLRLGDDALIAAQRLAEWSTRAPEMEEDIALSNIALDQLGVARMLLTYAGEIEGAGRDEDALAYLRGDQEFRNCLLVETPNGDFGRTMVKLLYLSAYQLPLYERLSESADPQLGAIAAKARKESAYHLDHATQWTVRLGDGTDESHRRMQTAVDELWPYTHELFEPDTVTDRLGEDGVAIDPAELRAPWLITVLAVLKQSTLDVPADGWRPNGGRSGRHTEHLSYVLGELQVLHRAHPGAQW
jgi:ring-1,2-phenylacetyl-CoA epoxidase subunit PaaC